MKKIIGIQGNICYEPIDISKEKLRILEDILDALYSKGSVSTFGIPVNTPLEIPRMICQSANNHSDIQISGVNSQLTVRYDNRFSDNAEKCFAYCKERMFLMQKALKEIGAKIKFSGINVQYVCEENLKSIEILKEKAFKFEENAKIFDVLGRVTYVKENTFYINLTVNNLRAVNKCEAVGVSLDVNDRYFDNFKEGSHNPDETLEKILDIHKKFENKTLSRLIKEGVFYGD